MNVTLSLPEEVVSRARQTAASKGLSLSRYVAEVVERELNGGHTRQEAAARIRRRMEEAELTGRVGKITWTRDELHER